MLGAPAWATPTFPGAIASHLGAPASPDCSVCHVGQQMRGTVNTPFGTAMRARGLLAYDEPSLLAALDRMATEMVDSDGDGTPDIEELRMAQDPNAAPGASSTFSPTYGCHVATANGRDPVAAIGAALVALAVAAFTTRRRRR